ncbi:hypothetical protein [Halobacterium zhouii]|uniref:hypothetical protein n=1 Tax=Halobacterium zhouii TaxID=2902624 RepID=UPI001E3BA156|nr:hypothetical protein [Halobacterium zhouii]
MDSNPDIPETGDKVAAFARTLEQLVLNSFTDGVPLEGTWDITVPVADAPNWTVTIAKSYSEEATSYQPDLLEE